MPSITSSLLQPDLPRFSTVEPARRCDTFSSSRRGKPPPPSLISPMPSVRLSPTVTIFNAPAGSVGIVAGSDPPGAEPPPPGLLPWPELPGFVEPDPPDPCDDCPACDPPAPLPLPAALPE